MKILAIADIHGDFEKLEELMERVKEDFDAIVCPGDFTDIGLSAQGFSREEMLELILEELKSRKKPVLVVPGNHDGKDLHNMFDNSVINLHGDGKIVDGVGFFGFGGAKTPFQTPFEPSEEETSQGLAHGWEKIKDCETKIMVVHNPPKNTKLDQTASGAHVGSEAVRRFILKNQPTVVISAHIHEGGREDVLEKTRLVYPGVAASGCYAIIETGKTLKVEAKTVPLEI
ncbi:MAG: metallophosphoesterase [Candidatus Aenigmatarchaeota archaeon]